MAFTSSTTSPRPTAASARSSVKTPAAWAADYDLMAFAEHLDVRSFQALSQGLGLGELRPVVKAPAAAAVPFRQTAAERDADADGFNNPASPVNKAEPPRQRTVAGMSLEALPSPGVMMAGAPVEPATTAAKKADKATKTPRAKRRLAFERRLMSWSIDFLFVTSSLAVALAVVTAVAAARASADTSLLELRPVTWLSSFAPYEILIGVYAVYLAYSVVFKLAVGKTFGESLLSGSERHPAAAR